MMLVPRFNLIMLMGPMFSSKISLQHDKWNASDVSGCCSFSLAWCTFVSKREKSPYK